MKKEYTKPILDIKAYAQFESVFTGCNREGSCTWSSIYAYDPYNHSATNSFTSHVNGIGSPGNGGRG